MGFLCQSIDNVSNIFKHDVIKGVFCSALIHSVQQMSSFIEKIAWVYFKLVKLAISLIMIVSLLASEFLCHG